VFIGVCVGVGHGNYGGEWSSFPQINLGFNGRVLKRGGISGEFWLLHDSQNDFYGLMSVSLKYIGKKITFNVGLFTPYELEVVLPIAGFVIPFGKKRNSRY